ncbi:conjugal transfer protein TrbG [Variovorax paradoxus]|nr:conjugal transfer protein TrbG [Variovorax paradoxus]KPV24136.1 conjugal transfer protein TrbG [Variovorax paradoxus]
MLVLVIGWLCTTHTAVRAATIPPEGHVDARVRTIDYDPEDVISLHGYVGYQIHLQFAEGETFVNLGSGDNGSFDVGAQRNHLFLKPKEAQANTNLTILTDRRTYHFDYIVSPRAPAGAAARRMIYSIRFNYPADTLRAAEEASKRAEVDAKLARPAAPRNWDYWFCGSESLRPIRASDDGHHIRLRFAEQAELPAIFVQNDDGTESLLNFNIDADEMVIHRLARRLVLRRGQLVGCVVNKALASGARAPGATVSPDVQRTTVGEQP